MIDEELYQFASDELNSDRRVPTLWNRACALARDDHDEARFLYKNLRVEELLEKQANGEPLPFGAVGLKKPSSSGKNSDDKSSESPPGLVNDVSLDMDAFADAPKTSDSADANAGVSSNRAFGKTKNDTTDISEDLLQELNDTPASVDTSTSIDTPASVAAADTVDASMNAVEETANKKTAGDKLADLIDVPTDDPVDDVGADATPPKVQLDPLVFPSQPLEGIEDSLNQSSSTERAPSAMELGTTPEGYGTGLSKDALPSVDPEISSLAAQASQRVQQKNAGTADHPVMDQTMDATESSDTLKEFESHLSAGDSLSVDDFEQPPADVLDKDEELAFLDNSIEENRENIIDQQREVLHQKDALSEDLERQADTWLPKDAVPGSTAVAGLGLGAAAALSGSGSDTADTGVGDAQQTQMGTQSDQYNDQVPVLSNRQADATDQFSGSASSPSNGPGAIDEILNPDKSLSDADLLSGRGKLYRVFSRGAEDNRAVPQGWSWAAMIVTFPWLLLKRMPGTALAYALLWVASLAGLAVTGLHWLDAPAGANSTIAVWPLAFAALAVIGLLLIPLIMANQWHAHSLKRRGYEEIATVRAPDKTRAVDRIVQLAA